MLLIYEILLLVNIFVGFFIATKLNKKYKWWVRLMCLMPALASLFAFHAALIGLFVVASPDLMLLFSTVLIYIILASRFTDKPLLDLRNDG